MIDDDEDALEDLVSEAGGALQEIQNQLGRRNDPRGKVRFPRGYLRDATRQRGRLPRNTGTPLQRRNASYSLMMADVLRWLAIRTDIWGAPLSMIVKEAICIYGAIADWILKEATRGHGSTRKFSYRSNKLVELGVIDKALRDELDWLWDIRCAVHFHEVRELEHERYARKDHDRARKAFQSLMDAVGAAQDSSD